MPPRRDLKALAKAAGITKQQYVDQENRARMKANQDSVRRAERYQAYKDSGRLAVVEQAYKDSGRLAVVEQAYRQRRKELYIEEQRILRNDPTWTRMSIEVQPEATEKEIQANNLR